MDEMNDNSTQRENMEMADASAHDAATTSAPVTSVAPTDEIVNGSADSSNEITSAASGQGCPTAAMGTWVPIGDMNTEKPFTELFPTDPKKVKQVADSMRATGFHPEDPIVRWRQKGVVVEGHVRLAAAKAAELEFVLVVDRDFPGENAAVVYAIECHTIRRNLTAAELMRCFKELDRRLATGARTDLAQHCARSGSDKGRARKSAAVTGEKLGISERKAEQLRTIDEHAPAEVKAALARDEMSVNAAYKATMAARRAADPEPQSAPMSADVSIYTSDPLNVRAADTGQPKPTTLEPAPAVTEANHGAGNSPTAVAEPTTDTPPPSQIDQWRQDLHALAGKHPRSWWPNLADVMHQVAAELDAFRQSGTAELAAPDTATVIPAAAAAPASVTAKAPARGGVRV